MGRGFSMPNGFNMQGLMRQAQKMQEKIQSAQEELKSKEVEATVGGGAIKVVFNGSQELNFFELETIAPMTVRNGKLVRSVLNSRTFIYKGSADQLRILLEKEYQLNSKEIVK